MITLLSNRYQILETLGKGGFGETFLAVDTQMPSARKCVIKQLNPCVQSSEIPDWLKERFKREAAVLEELGQNHPQIPGLYAYFSEDNDFYLVQEWIEGETLSQIYQQRGNFSEQEVKDLLIRILPILDYIHNHHIIHRDIKPDNIIIRDSDRQPVLIDFGIVKEAVATQMNMDGKTPYSIALGTPGYMPPEQAAGRPVYSSDLYSLGLTAVFLLTGKTPQYLPTDLQTGEILWRKEAPHVHSHLATIIDRTLRFHPKDRFPNAKKMLAALKAVPATSTAATIVINPSPPTPSLKTPPEPYNSPSDSESEPPWILLALGSFLVVSAVIGALTLGFMLAAKQRSRPLPSPSPTVESPEPQTFPSLSNPEPRRERPRVRQIQPQVTPQASPSPEPEVSPSPSPETSPTPDPQSSPTSETAPIADPTTVTPESVQPQPQPSPESVQPQPQPSPESVQPQPQPSPEAVQPPATPSVPDIIIDTEPKSPANQPQSPPSTAPKSSSNSGTSSKSVSESNSVPSSTN
ncbi:serine/threonine protein kinase [Rippkaea orientalis PCC 8801]|uniref:non-specific serine/threonine protein kinase n=1 Tax=Rippkaea orientalis (strain PCC 8801 / RF-1) TaxID=41431 RepID=B7JUG2_RIPO1|nr:serine/threonine-protein kinase [Rippkaea orientalis]ACK64542.1 serine/threonine protein kinase [Rippkaea orientalis PCC 8801]